MSLEALIFTLCVSGDYACNDALKAYYEYNPYLKSKVVETRKEFKDKISKEMMFVISTYAALEFDKAYTLKLYKNVTYTHKSDKNMIYLTWRF